MRSRLYFDRIVEGGYEPNPDRRRLAVRKNNYGRTGGEIDVTWRMGVFVADAPASGLDRTTASIKAERVFLQLLRQFAEQGRRVNASGGPHYAPKLFAEHPAAEGCTRRALKQAMEALLSGGKLRIECEGPPSRRVSFLAEAAS